MRPKVDPEDLEQKPREDNEQPQQPKVDEQATTSGNDMMASFLARANEQKKQEQATPVTAESVQPKIVEVQEDAEEASEKPEGEKESDEAEEPETTKDQEKDEKDTEQKKAVTEENDDDDFVEDTK